VEKYGVEKPVNESTVSKTTEGSSYNFYRELSYIKVYRLGGN
jgi:hypothetical protein